MLMMVVDDAGVPIGRHVAHAQLHERSLADLTRCKRLRYHDPMTVPHHDHSRPSQTTLMSGQRCASACGGVAARPPCHTPCAHDHRLDVYPMLANATVTSARWNDASVRWTRDVEWWCTLIVICIAPDHDVLLPLPAGVVTEC